MKNQIMECDYCEEPTPAVRNIAERLAIWDIDDKGEYDNMRMHDGYEGLNKHLCLKHFEQWQGGKLNL